MATLQLGVPGKNHELRAVVKASVLAFTEASDGDVYINASSDHTITMRKGDSIFVPTGSTLSIWVFSKSSVASAYNATLQLDEVEKPAATSS